ncbi:MAG: hypothetical protein PVS2B2_18580 [Candidatus Acidiferrum sp.]
MGGAQYTFEIKCRYLHPGGEFNYCADDLRFTLDDFSHFAKELGNMRQGITDQAALKDTGEMFVFQLDRKGSRLHLIFNIREYLPPEGSAGFNAALEVDYDFFVNKLGRQVEEFLAELRNVEPEKPNWGFPGI